MQVFTLTHISQFGIEMFIYLRPKETLLLSVSERRRKSSDGLETSFDKTCTYFHIFCNYKRQCVYECLLAMCVCLLWGGMQFSGKTLK